MRDPWPEARPLEGLAIDHIGIVVHDVAPVVAQLRDAGFRVSDPVALEGDAGPLGQDSAHCVFANGYVEISAPTAPDNHLVPYLADGPGIRILALRADDADGAHARFATRELAMGPVRDSARVVRLDAGEARARFRWFPVADILSGVLSALVEHRDPGIVFAPELHAHPNGARRLADIVFGAPGTELAKLPAMARGDLPAALIDPSLDAAIAGFSVSPLDRAPLLGEGYALRALA